VDRARRVGEVMSADEADVLIAAAYLHDIGYAPALMRTGCHPVDAAIYLRELGEERLAGLVAYHSGQRRKRVCEGSETNSGSFSGSGRRWPML